MGYNFPDVYIKRHNRHGFGWSSLDGKKLKYLKTVSGSLVTIYEALSLATMSVLGNSTQEGTPSPDNPVEVVGTGERTGNLFDYEYFFKNANVSNQGTTICITYSLNKNTAYTVYTNVPLSSAGYTSVFTTAGSETNVNTNNHGVSIGLPRTVMTDDSGTITLYLRTIYYPNAIVLTKEDFVSGKYWVSFVEGSYAADTLPPYEPYGYKVAVTASGRNLFDYEYFFENAENVQDTTISVVYTLEKNTAYTVYTNVPLSSAGYVSVFAITGEQYYVSTRNDGVSLGNPRVIMTDDLGRLTLHLRTIEYPNTITLTKEDFITGKYWVSFVKGTYTASTMPTYEPYKPPQSFNVYSPGVLHGVGDAHDTVILDFDKRKAELVKAIGFTQLKSNDNWIDNFYPVIYKSLSPTMKGSAYAMCNYAEYMPTAKVPAVRASNIYGTAIAMYNSDKIQGVTDGDSFKTWLSDKDVYAYYPLATSTTTDITSLQDWGALPQLRGTWVLTASGGTEPELNVSYYTYYED